jgi:cellulose synthase/poly-beta-1,6-N-acetylglucosamine synthase-like glycosyltransferase
MNLSFENVLLVVYIFVALIITVALAIIIFRLKKVQDIKKVRKMSDFLLFKFPKIPENKMIWYLFFNQKLFLYQFIELSQTLRLSEKNRQKILNYLKKQKFAKRYIKNLRSFRKYNRIEAATILTYLPEPDVVKALQKALKKEKKYLVKIYIANALAEINGSSALPEIIESIINAPKLYQKRIQILVRQFEDTFYEYIPQIINLNNEEVQLLIISFAANYIAQDLKEYLLSKIESKNSVIAHAAADAFFHQYSSDPLVEELITKPDPYIKKLAINELGKIGKKENILQLLEYLYKPETRESTIYSLANILRNFPQYLDFFLDLFKKEKDPQQKKALGLVLSCRLDYLLLNITSADNEVIKAVIKEILVEGQASNIISFLNRNKNIEIENEVLSVIDEIITNNEHIKNELCTYLDERLLQKLKKTKLICAPPPKELKKEKFKVLMLYIFLILIISFFPALYIIRHWPVLLELTPQEHLTFFVIDFNYYLVFYSSAINLIYILLLLFSFLGLMTQAKFWNIKKITILFKKNMVPSISVIAPAYSEEATIIESANSLLNLKYPDYELIIVNDGSPDKTLDTLIEYFKLEKVDRKINYRLACKPIRGIYINESLPKLIVVDKENGGKADSLNAGINISIKEFFCGIDADSLLEPDALLKVVSPALDYEEETVGSGGNILAVNGCKIDRGSITQINIPHNHLARLQTIEYLRAFMAGRIGWAYLDALLIISGAFGLFNKERTIAAGGYLTEAGTYHKDTVGEDMELVVRLTKVMQEKKLKYKIHYAYNANCWTEVPESMKILYRQRDRWQRGLIDILIFHLKLLFNPKYRSEGMVALPYFFIFEFIGPLIEAQGYLMVFLAAILGLLNAKIALMLFLTVVLMGVFISLSSVLLGSDTTSKFSLKEITILIIYATVENFGFRQVMSMLRVVGYFNAMKKPKGWGKMVRKGFAAK